MTASLKKPTMANRVLPLTAYETCDVIYVKKIGLAIRKIILLIYALTASDTFALIIQHEVLINPLKNSRVHLLYELHKVGKNGFENHQQIMFKKVLEEVKESASPIFLFESDTENDIYADTLIQVQQELKNLSLEIKQREYVLENLSAHDANIVNGISSEIGNLEHLKSLSQISKEMSFEVHNLDSRAVAYLPIKIRNLFYLGKIVSKEFRREPLLEKLMSIKLGDLYREIHNQTRSYAMMCREFETKLHDYCGSVISNTRNIQSYIAHKLKLEGTIAQFRDSPIDGILKIFNWGFQDDLIDVKILSKIFQTHDRDIFVIAGYAHTELVSAQLKELGYETEYKSKVKSNYGIESGSLNDLQEKTRELFRPKNKVEWDTMVEKFYLSLDPIDFSYFQIKSDEPSFLDNLSSYIAGFKILIKSTDNSEESTLLDKAVRSSNAPIAKILVSLGADTDELDEFGFTPVHRAVMNSDLPILETKLRAKSNERCLFGTPILGVAYFPLKCYVMHD